jgi:hypothetical protein
MPADKHKPRPIGYVQCSYTPTGDPEADCGAAVTWHVLWDRASMQASLTCDEHMELIRARWMYEHRHPVGTDCNMPGALWHFPLNRCEVPGGAIQATARVAMPAAR